MALDLVVVDAFTSSRFRGNPAAVALVDTFPSDIDMQNIALEMNLSETAFARPMTNEKYELRWFTPTSEVILCGHATLATAHVIGHSVRFDTKSGILACTFGEDGWIMMDFPTDVPRPLAGPSWFDKEGLLYFGRGRFDALVVLASEEMVRNFQPDPASIARFGERGVVITASSTDGRCDFVSRFFAPLVGVPEDPVTGSAHCLLAEYWGDRLGRDSLVGEQLSARGGSVRVNRRGTRVIVAGKAVTTSRVRMEL